MSEPDGAWVCATCEVLRDDPDDQGPCSCGTHAKVFKTLKELTAGIEPWEREPEEQA